MLYTAPGSNNHPLPDDTGWLLGTGQVLSPGAVYNTASPVNLNISFKVYHIMYHKILDQFWFTTFTNIIWFGTCFKTYRQDKGEQCDVTP